jgi:curved DNA binding protein
VVDLIKIGEAIIAERCAAIYRTKVKGKDVEKGVSFPICISINECVCHNCPLDNDTAGNDTIADGDMCKIDLGVHVDGYIAVVAHTVHVGLQASDVKGDLAAAYGAAFTAAKVASGLIRPGNTNTQVTAAIKKVTEAYGVSSICGTIMHQVKRFVMDGNKMILLRDEPEQKVVACTFEENEVFVVDIAMTTSEGKPKEKNQKPTVYKRVVERKYGLKIKHSRVFFSEVIRRFPTLPFSLRYIEDETSAKVGLRECLGHELILPYPILYEKKDSQIVHYKVRRLLLSFQRLPAIYILGFHSTSVPFR